MRGRDGSPTGPAGTRWSRRGIAFRAACLLAAWAILPGTGCAPARHRLIGEEARDATAFFASLPEISFPVRASYSGVAEISDRPVPLLAGLYSRTPSEETIGFYDPMGRAVLFLRNDGGWISVSRGPAAKEFPRGDIRPVEAGPVSLGRILSGGPGYAVSGGEAGRMADGTWILAGGKQTLFSDPSRRLLFRADYDISGKRIRVTYPGRDDPGPPRVVEVEIMGNRIVLRRDEE